MQVKRNPDDIGHAFLGYQQSLAWLAGMEELYDPIQWVTRACPKGHFKGRYDLVRVRVRVGVMVTDRVRGYG
jgi:hypothetical protein